MIQRIGGAGIDCYDFSELSGSTSDTGQEIPAEPSYLHQIIPGTTRYLTYGSSKMHIGVWDLAERTHVRCAKFGEQKFIPTL